MAQEDVVLVLDVDTVDQYAKPRQPAAGQRSLFREEDHPRAADGKWTDGTSHRNAPAKAGDTFDFPDSTTWAQFKGVVRDAGNGVGEIVDADPGKGYVRSKMPMESIHRVIDDLSGRVAAKSFSGDSDVDAVLGGKAKFLGRGNDGLAFDVGNGNVVKASSELHFHWNNGIRSQQEGADRIRNQVTVNEKLRAAGVPGLLPQRLVEHEGRAYAVMPKLDMEQPIDQARAMQVYETIKAMRDAGYTIGDDIQAGVGTDGKAYIFDTGAVRPLATSGPAASHDKQDDESRIERFFQKAGVPRPAGLNPDADYEDAVQSFGRHKKNADKRGRWDPGPAAYLRDSLSRNFAALDEHMREFLGDSHQEMIDELTAAAQPKGESMQATATDKYAAARSLFHEEDHPRGQPENAGQFAPKGGGTATAKKPEAKPAAAKSLFGDDGDSPAKTPNSSIASAFQSAFDAAGSRPAPELPAWQPKLFDAEPTGQKTMFDAGIEKGYGKKKPAAKQQQSLLGPSLVEKIEAEIAKQTEASRPMPGQKAMFSRIASARDEYAKRKPAAGQKTLGGEHWITIGGSPDGSGAKHAGGTPVKVDGSGKIVAGPAALKAKNVSQIGGQSRSDDQSDVPSNQNPATPANHSAGLPSEKESSHDPIADYKANGTRSRAFKAWFGDWENDPANASKVVDPETGEPQETAPIAGTGSKVLRDGKPVSVYHGTARGGFDAFDPKRIGDANQLLYGPGFYFTEDASVADEYAGATKFGIQHYKTEQEALDGIQKNADEWRSRYGDPKRNGMENLKFFIKREPSAPEGSDLAYLVEGHGYYPTAIRLKNDLTAADLVTLEKHFREVARAYKAAGDKDNAEYYWSLSKSAGNGSRTDIDRLTRFLKNPTDSLPYATKDDEKHAATGLEKIGNGLIQDQRERKEVYLNIRQPFDIDQHRIPFDRLDSRMAERIRDQRKHKQHTLRELQVDRGEQAARQRNDADRAFAALRKEMGPDADRLKDHRYVERARAQGDSAINALWESMSDRGNEIWGYYVSAAKASEESQEESNKYAAEHRELDTAGADYHEIHTVTQDKTRVREVLKGLGYDGLTHTGGRIMGNRDHRVWIAFEPNQIKSVDNQGTFNPNDNRMRYQREDSDNGPAHWITIGGHPSGNGKRHAGGTPVKVDGSGNIVAGPDSLEGKPIAAIDQDKKPEAPAQHFHASEFTGDFRKDFKGWAKQSAVPRLQSLGYDNIDAQMIAFKALRSGKPESAFEILNGYADKKGPPKPREQQPEQPQPEPAAPEPQAVAEPAAPAPTPEQSAQATPPQPEPNPEPEIPAAPEWFNKLREALESGTAAKSFTPDDGTADSPAGDSTDDIHFAEWTPDEDPADAPPPSVTKLPDAIDPLQHVQRLPDGRLVGATQMNVRSLSIDPNRFQYKFVGVGSDGVTKELKDSKKFNPMLGGQLLVWQDPGDGKTYVINGHHRYDLAMRSLEANPDDPWNGNMSVYFIDAATPAEARALGAVTNIAEGRGTAIDAAKFLRDTNAGLDDLQKHGVSVRGAIARDAVPLSKLSPTIWQSVAQEMTNPEQGIAIAKHLGDDHDSQDELFQIIKRREQKTEKEIPAAQVEEMAREMKMTPKIEEDGGLLGDYFKRSLLAERAVLKAAVNRAIAGEQNTFQAVSSKKRVGMLSSEGNVIDAEGNRDRAKDAARQMEDFKQQSNWAGNPIAEAVSKAAERLANEPRKAKAIERELIEHVRGLLAAGKKADQLGESGGSVPVDAASGLGESSGGERYSRRGSVQRYAALTAALERAFSSAT